MQTIKHIQDTYNGPIPIGILYWDPYFHYEDKTEKWNDDGIRYTFYDFKDDIVKLKNNEKFKIFDKQLNQWCYFKYHSSIFNSDKLIYPEYIEPITYWLTKENIITYVSIAITFIISLISLCKN